ncbi:Phospholipid scramblase 2, partial [Orchesella cincta]
PQDYLNPRYEGVYAAAQPPAYNTGGIDPIGIPNMLQPLVFTDYLVIKQKKEWLEIACGCETKNKYEIHDQQAQLIYKAQENSDFLLRHWCGPLRPFILEIKDKDDKAVVALDRPFACQSPCCPCCLQKMAIFCPPGHLIGSIEQQNECLPELHIKDEQNVVVFIVKKPMFTNPCGCGEAAFPVYASDGINECGRIVKGRSDFFHEAFTDSDVFGIQFPPGVNPYLKILLMGATFLIDYMYFESTNR